MLKQLLCAAASLGSAAPLHYRLKLVLCCTVGQQLHSRPAAAQWASSYRVVQQLHSGPAAAELASSCTVGQQLYSNNSSMQLLLKLFSDPDSQRSLLNWIERVRKSLPNSEFLNFSLVFSFIPARVDCRRVLQGTITAAAGRTDALIVLQGRGMHRLLHYCSIWTALMTNGAAQNLSLITFDLHHQICFRD